MPPKKLRSRKDQCTPEVTVTPSGPTNDQAILSKDDFKESKSPLRNLVPGSNESEENSEAMPTSSSHGMKDSDARISDMKKSIEDIIENFSLLPCGPIYENMNKLLAELYLKSKDELSGIFHLLESHGATFRSQTCRRIQSNARKSRMESHVFDKEFHVLDKEFLSFYGPLQGRSGVLKRLKEFPTEWTILQLTLEFDPSSRSSGLIKNGGSGLYITRLSCGSICDAMNNEGEGGLPFTHFVPPLAKWSENPTVMDAMKKIIDELNDKSLRPQGSSSFYSSCSLQIEGIVHEIEVWLRDWQFILCGRLVDSKLQHAIKKAVDKLLVCLSPSLLKDPEDCSSSLGKSVDLSCRSHQILYLLASSSLLHLDQVCRVVSSLINDKATCKFVARGIFDIHTTFIPLLTSAERHPVILILDEELDLIPFEMTASLRGHPVTRVPNIHILSALLDYHRNKVLKYGININNGSYVINPSKDFPSIETEILPVLKSCVPSWTGSSGVPPSPEQFLQAIQESEVFLYCGHGGGNQFLSSDDIQRIHVKGVVFLMGCSSSKNVKLGGRISMYSLCSSYFMAGCPCIVGNLWNVLNDDCNRITKAIIQSWSCESSIDGNNGGSVKLTKEMKRLCINDGAVGKLTKETKKLGIQSSGSSLGPPRLKMNLLEVIARVKTSECRYYLNRAALVVRGLPVFAASK